MREKRRRIVPGLKATRGRKSLSGKRGDLSHQYEKKEKENESRIIPQKKRKRTERLKILETHL